jgi:putative DNA primase/helicase
VIRADEIHRQIGAGWPAILAQLGIAEKHLRKKKAGPCPACGGTDRFTFDDRFQKGDYFCRHCGAGDGFTLLMKLHGWTFKEALTRVINTAGLNTVNTTAAYISSQTSENCGRTEEQIAEPTERVRRLMRERCPIVSCDDAIKYLEHRGLWPLPKGCTLDAHVSVDYFDDGKRLGRFPALVAAVRDVKAELVTAHVTYLEHGRKLEGQPRKLLSPLTGRIGCAARLMHLHGDELGIAEGIETALAAARIHNMPVWSALSTSLLAKFEPPSAVKRVVIFADRDAAGLEAAARLMEKLQGRVDLELRLPPAPCKDWNHSFNNLGEARAQSQ